MTTTDEQMIAALHSAVATGEFHIFDPETTSISDLFDDER